MRRFTTHWALVGLVLSGAMFSLFGGPIVESTLCTPCEIADPGFSPLGFNLLGFGSGSQGGDTEVAFSPEFGDMMNTLGSNLFFPFFPLIIPADGPQEQEFFLNFGSSDALGNTNLTSTSVPFETNGSAVPEPATFALLGTGLAALGVLRSRRR